LWGAPAGVATAGVIAGLRTGSLLCGLLTAVALVVTLARFWMRTTYIAGERGLEIQCLGRRQFLSWSRVRAFQPIANSVLLHIGRPSLGERPQALRIPLPPSDRAALAELRWRLIAAQEITAA